jgi:hypothetical protein
LKEGWSGGLIILYIQYFLFRPGWLIHFILLTFVIVKNNNLFNRKSNKAFRSSLRNRSTSAEAALWNILKSRNLDGAPNGEYHINHPGRNQPLQYIDYHSTPATPPLKGGETNMNLLNFDIIIRLPFLIRHVTHFQTP